MRHVLIASCAALAIAVSGQAVAAAAATSAPITIETSWDVSLDANGNVTDVAQHTAVKSILADPLATAIRGWAFQPGQIDGQPAPTQTTLHLSVAVAQQANDGYAVRVLRASTGGRVDNASTAPIFPTSGAPLRSGSLSGLVVLKIRYDESGSVISAEPAPGAPKVQKALSRSAIRAVREWTFQPERVGGHGIASTVYVPICFSVSTSRQPDDGCKEWASPEAPKGIAEGAAFALEPAATLKSDVVGQLL